MRLSDCKIGDVVHLPLEHNQYFTLTENYTRFLEATILKDGLIGWGQDERTLSHRYGGTSKAININNEYKQNYSHLVSQINIGMHCPCKLVTSHSKKQTSILPLAIATSTLLFKAIFPLKEKVFQNEAL